MSTMALRFMAVLSALAGMLAGVHSTEGAEVTPEKPAFRIPDFKSVSYPSGDAEVNQVSEAYQSAITELKKQLWTKELSGEQQTYVIYLLGELRAVTAATLLVEHIDFETPVVDLKIAMGRWGPYPATEALVKIGRPSVKEILAKAQRKQNDSRLKQMAIVIRAVEGIKVARLRVQDAITNAPNAEAADHLRLLLGVLDAKNTNRPRILRKPD